MIKEETLQCQEERKNVVSKNVTRHNRLSFSSWVSRLCLTDEAKTVTQYDVVLNICRGNV